MTPGTTTGSSTQGTTGTTGTSSQSPQAHTSAGDTGAKGFLPQTGEWMKQNWLLLLGLVILLSTVGLIVKKKRKNG
ncbi:LPXTG cell wall anchor domain-containing protein [Secundilactobacillus silagei]|nr:LPXTG cell wall anchor domain-containing protein [Secundilactobacillus silagei]